MQFVPKELNTVVKQREKGEKALLALVQEEKMEEWNNGWMLILLFIYYFI